MRSNCAQTVLELSKHPTAVHPITGALLEPEHVLYIFLALECSLELLSLLPTYQPPAVYAEHKLAVDANKRGTSGGNLYYGVSLQILPNRHVIEPPSLIPTGSCGAVLQTTRSLQFILARKVC